MIILGNHSLTAQGSDLPFSYKSMVSVTHEQNTICSKTQLDGIVHEQTIFVGRSRGLLSANEKEGKKCIE